MDAAVLHALGKPPRFEEFPEPTPGEGEDDDTAAAIPNPGLSAWLSLKHSAKLASGETVLVLGATGVTGNKSFPNQNPLGRTIFCTFDSDQGMTIIGVVGDVRQRGPEREPMPECYMTYGQHAFNGLSLVARTTGDPNALAGTLQHLVRERSPDVPMKFMTMEAVLSENVAVPRFRTLLFAVFAGLAVWLAMAGVYGVMAYAVGQRSNEIGCG